MNSFRSSTDASKHSPNLSLRKIDATFDAKAEQPQPIDSSRRERLTPEPHTIRPSYTVEARTDRSIEAVAGKPLFQKLENSKKDHGRHTAPDVASDERQMSPSEDLRLARLREAVLLSQQRARHATGKALQGPEGFAQRRVSPIKEDVPSTMSPTLDEAFASPLTSGLESTSTESTGSIRTIKGSMPPTPGGALRTPSYPFPYVPGTPSSWSSNFHRPFTTLSPTVSAQNVRDATVSRERLMSSGPSTPAGSTATFIPGDVHNGDAAGDAEQYPSPSLYDLVLALNCEPGLDAWWAVVINVMRDWYGAERATLAIPADASELETVPWGQKATYNAIGSLDISHPSTEGRTTLLDPPLQKVHDAVEKATSKTQASATPRIAARHSYAGFEGGRPEPNAALETKSDSRPERPGGPTRTLSHAPRLSTKPDGRIVPETLPPTTNTPHPLRQQTFIGSVSDSGHTSAGLANEQGPYEAVFPSLRALDLETDALLDSSGVLKILERGRVVTLTRDYAVYSTSRGPSAEPPSDSEQSDRETAGVTKPTDAKKAPLRPPKADRKQSDYFSRAKLPTTYEEYEQFPVSPWAQSPAPSPAVQTDSEENPFFTSPKVDEDTFNPDDQSPNYARYTQVPAIGIDRASTITHIPLIHPVLSQILPPLPADTSNPGASSLRRASTSERFPDDLRSIAHQERRAPIAVISFLSQTVPYPRNLTDSLKLLAPHLATTFANANQYTNALKQAASIRHRRVQSASKLGSAPIEGDPESLEDLLRLDLDDINASVSGSMTSPSDYSAHSRFSPGNSLQGTPGWDPANVCFSHSISNTPAHTSGTENMENYFEMKKRNSSSSKESSSTHGRPRQLDANETNKRTSSTHSKGLDQSPWSGKRDGSSEKKTPVIDRSTKRRSSSPSHQLDVISPRKTSQKLSRIQESNHRPHTQLHSFGADFSTSFSTLQATASTFAPQPGGGLNHARSNSIEVHDMLPPSEKLLRIIVDALPVQIFMAAPSDGSITWANAKYLAYRGQDSREIMQDPWHSIHADDWAEYMELWKRCLSTGMQLSHKVRLQRFDGQYRWFFVKIAPLKDKRQNIVHWIGTNMDFHEQHVAEINAAKQQETAASEAKYRAVANSSPQIVFAATKGKGVTFCNSQWTNYSGQAEDQAGKLGFMDCVHSEDLEKCRLPSLKADGTTTEVPVSMPTQSMTKPETPKGPLLSEDGSDSPTITSPGSDEPSRPTDVHRLPQAQLSKLASTGILKVARDADGRPSYSTEVRLRNKEGHYRWHLVRVLRSDLKDSEDDDQTWYGTCTDINDHKLLEQTLKETMDAKSRFLSNMSHEIRTPLNGITGMVNFLIDSKLTAEQMEHVNIIRNSTEGLRDLINDILDLSKVEAGMITLNTDWLHVRSLIEEVNDLTSALAIDKGLELNYIVEENVPSLVKGDRFRIRQVLLNVIGNAIKFTQRGEVFVRCYKLDETASISTNEVLVRFEVIDTGNGFTEKEAEFLFKRFSQIDGSSTRQHGGTGLGLAISMQLVELHGGIMRAFSVPGKGSTFTFSVKFQLPDKDGHSTVPVPSPGQPETAMSDRLSDLKSLPSESATPSRDFTQHPTTSERTVSPVASVVISDMDPKSPLSSSSSVQSLSITQTSSRSERSSRSSYPFEQSLTTAQPQMVLKLPSSASAGPSESRSESGNSSVGTETVQPASSPAHALPTPKPSNHTATAQLPLLSVLVVCPLQWSRLATVRHIEMTLPKATPYKITAREDISESLGLISGDDAVSFTHVVLSVKEADQVVPFMNALLGDSTSSSQQRPFTRPATSLIIVSDLSQRRQLMQYAPHYDYDALQRDHRLHFVFKPLKPSKLAVFFDPKRERDGSSDMALEGAQAIAVSQKQVFDEMKRRLGSKNIKVLLVEDNKTNQMVLLKFLKRADVKAQEVMDGVQCTDELFKQPWGTYSLILCDLHMPNKDGYRTCKDIRKWERKNHYPHLPVIALSANVLGDVYAKCVEAGFNGYVTKPVDFKELSEVMMTFLDPTTPGKPHPFMQVNDKRSR